MAETFEPLDVAEHIKTVDDVEAYINVWLEDCTAQELAYLLGCLARSEGMSEVARRTGLNRVSLYHALSDRGNPTLDTIMRVLDALGYRLKVERKEMRLASSCTCAEGL